MSGSVTGAPLYEASAGIRSFVQDSHGSFTYGGIVFAGGVQDAGAITDNEKQALRGLDYTINASKGGSTALFDGVASGITKVAGQDGRKTLVVFSDGGENESTASLYEVIGSANANGVSIVTIGVPGSRFEEGVGNLLRMSQATGGFYLSTGQNDEIAATYRQVYQKLDEEYLLTYTLPTVDTRPERFVRVTMKDTPAMWGMRTYTATPAASFWPKQRPIGSDPNTGQSAPLLFTDPGADAFNCNLYSEDTLPTDPVILEACFEIDRTAEEQIEITTADIKEAMGGIWAEMPDDLIDCLFDESSPRLQSESFLWNTWKQIADTIEFVVGWVPVVSSIGDITSALFGIHLSGEPLDCLDRSLNAAFGSIAMGTFVQRTVSSCVSGAPAGGIPGCIGGIIVQETGFNFLKNSTKQAFKKIAERGIRTVIKEQAERFIELKIKQGLLRQGKRVITEVVKENGRVYIKTVTGRFVKKELPDQIKLNTPEMARYLLEKGYVSSYNTLNSLTGGARKEAGVEIHHLIERRMVENDSNGLLIIAVQEADTRIPCIVLDVETHNKITRELQERMPYGFDNYDGLNKAIVLQHYREVYRKYGLEHFIDDIMDPLFN